MTIINKISVKYSGYNKYNEYETKEVNFASERDADIFMSEMENHKGIKFITKIVNWKIEERK